jgi:hypothetical protein
MRKLALSLALVLPSLSSSFVAAQAADSSYTLKVEAPPAKKGQKSVAHIHITPGAGFHMNKEFPTSLSLSPPDGVTLDKQKLGIKDAAKWEETEGAFDVAYTAAGPGKKVVTGELKFAVCSANSCDPKKSPVRFEIDVK